jgi:hypothetical protein
MIKKNIVNNQIYLYLRPSLLNGIGRLFDLMGYTNDYSVLNRYIESDFDTFKSDWLQIGKDIRTSIDSYKEEMKVNAKEVSKKTK